TTAVPGAVREEVCIGQRRWAATGHVAERSRLARLEMVLAPLEIVDRSRCPGVVAVRVRRAGKLATGIARLRVVTVGVPVQAFAGPVEDAVHRQARGRRRGEEQRSGEAGPIARAENQIAVARQDAHVVAVLVERVLPAALADDPQQRQLARMHVWI